MSTATAVKLVRRHPDLLKRLPDKVKNQEFFGGLRWELDMISTAKPVLDRIASLVSSGAMKQAAEELEAFGLNQRNDGYYKGKNYVHSRRGY